MQTAEIDDLSRDSRIASIATSWQLFINHVMGGVSHGIVIRDVIASRPAMRMCGVVSLENNGGSPAEPRSASQHRSFDASTFRGVELDVIGNAQEYNVHLRTVDLTRPWQSYRQSFKADEQWQTVQIHFENFLPHRTDIPCDTHRLRRIGIAAIARAFTEDLAVAGVRFFP